MNQDDVILLGELLNELGKSWEEHSKYGELIKKCKIVLYPDIWPVTESLITAISAGALLVIKFVATLMLESCQFTTGVSAVL